MSDGIVETTQAEATSAPVAPATTSQAPAAPVTATSQTAQPSAPAVDPSWLKTRLDETRASATRAAQQAASQEYARKEAELQARYDQVQTQLRALVGVQPPQNTEVDGIRSQFGKIYPGLAKMEAAADQLLALQQRSGDLEAQNQHYWSTYARQATDRLYGTAEKALGTPLTDDAKELLHNSFASFIESSPERIQRYQNDPSIVEDFWKAFSSGFIDPARRVTAAGVVNRAAASSALPQDAPGGVPHATQAPKPQNLDERAAAAWQLYQHNQKP